MGRDDRDDKNKIKRRKVSSSDKKNPPQASRSSNNARSSAKKKKTSSKSNGRFKGAKTVGVVFLTVLVVGVAVASGIVFASLRNTEPVTKALLEKKTYQTTELYYADGQLLSKAETSDKKDPVSDLSEIDKDVQNALIATEDERFYEHNGVDLRGLARSVVKTLTGTKQGGSTIPMQVSKMLITSQEQSITRKIKDIYYAYEMSKTVSKEDILLAYLNNFYAGRGLYGVKAAAQGYFSKDISKKDAENDITPGEAALLIGSTNNPALYSPYTTDKLNGMETKEDLENKLLFYVNTQDDTLDEPTDVEMQMIDKLSSWGLIPDGDIYKQLKNKTMVVRKAVPNEKAKNKQKIILGKMLRLNYITQEQYDEEVAKPIEIKLSRSKTNVVSSVEDYVYSEVIDSLMEQGYTKEEANNMYYNGGLRIYTTIDSGMQDNLEKQYDNDDNFPDRTIGDDGVIQPQSAMVILDYKTGQIKSLIGGRHVKGKRTLNRATTPKQPGSTIKPLSVYAPAIDTLEYTQSTAYSDARGGYKFKENKDWNPKTTTPGRDTWSLRKALAMSSNTIAVKTAESLGKSYSEATDVMIDYLKNFGISTLLDSKTKEVRSTDRQFSSLVLGGMAHGISPLEMAAAYATLANGGQYIEPTVFTTITTYDGQLLVKSNPEENRVVSEDVAYVITDMLQAVVTEGTGKAASLGSKIPVAGKTGTTNDGLDVWFAGYTPYYVGVTYIGDDAGRTDAEGNKIPRRSVPGTSSTAAGLWAKVMGPIHENLTKAEFNKPAGVYFTKINPVDGGTSSYGVSAAFVEGTYPSRATSQPAPVQKPSVEEEEEEKPSTDDTGDGGNPPEENGDQGGETIPPEEPTPTPPGDNNNNNNNPPPTPEPPVDNTQGGNSQEGNE